MYVHTPYRALHFSGNSTVEGAINWLEGHEADVNLDEPLMVKKVQQGEDAAGAYGSGILFRYESHAMKCGCKRAPTLTSFL